MKKDFKSKRRGGGTLGNSQVNTFSSFEFNKNMIEVQKIWLKTLAKLAKQAKKELNDYMLTENDLPPMSVNKLIGYAGSAETILKIKRKK